MKNIIFTFFATLCLFTCDEIPPDVGTGGGGPTPPDPTEVVRKVLIEEFTGVRCVNCPAGSEAIEQLLDIHGDRLVAVSIHAGFFAIPYNESLYDLKTEDGSNVLSLLGDPIGFPTAVINRKLFDGETGLQLGRTKWAGLIDQELTQKAVAKLDFNADYDSSSREVEFDVDLEYLETLSLDNPRLTIYILENNIQDYQETPEGKISDYNHKHVLRDAITAFDGDPLSNGTTIGTVENLSYSYTLPDDWVASNVNAIAFFHNGGDEKDILQVEELHIEE